MRVSPYKVILSYQVGSKDEQSFEFRAKSMICLPGNAVLTWAIDGLVRRVAAAEAPFVVVGVVAAFGVSFDATHRR